MGYPILDPILDPILAQLKPTIIRSRDLGKKFYLAIFLVLSSDSRVLAVDRLDRSALTEGRVFTRLTIQWPFRLRSEF